MTDRATLAERFRKAAADWKGSWLTTVDVHVEVRDLPVIADALSTPSASAGQQAETVATAVEQFQARVVEMVRDGCTMFHLSVGGGWNDLNIEDRCKFILEMWGAPKRPLDFKDSYAHPQPQQADGRQQEETTVLPAETIAYWFMDNHPGLDLLHADITDLIDRARIDGARQQSDGRGAVIEPDTRALLQFVGWVDSWVSNPVGAYSVYALDGLFQQTRDRISALSQAPATDGPAK